jgi:hypothetical protein
LQLISIGDGLQPMTGCIISSWSVSAMKPLTECIISSSSLSVSAMGCNLFQGASSKSVQCSRWASICYKEHHRIALADQCLRGVANFYRMHHRSLISNKKGLQQLQNAFLNRLQFFRGAPPNKYSRWSALRYRILGIIFGVVWPLLRKVWSALLRLCGMARDFFVNQRALKKSQTWGFRIQCLHY